MFLCCLMISCWQVAVYRDILSHGLFAFVFFLVKYLYSIDLCHLRSGTQLFLIDLCKSFIYMRNNRALWDSMFNSNDI